MISSLILSAISSLGIADIANANHPIIASIPVPGNPQLLAFNPASGDMYVTHTTIPGSVSVIDSQTNTMVDNITLIAPYGIAYNPANGDMYVTLYESINNTFFVSVIDSLTNTVVDNIPVGTTLLHGIAFNPSNGNMYVTNSGSNTVSVIDSSTNTVVDNIAVGEAPDGITHNPIDRNMYVINTNSATISVIDSSTNTVVHTIAVKTPRDIDFNPANGNIYISTAVDTVDLIATPSPAGPTTGCSEDNIQHWDKILFKIVSPELAAIVDNPVNTLFDIKVQNDPTKESLPQDKVLEFLKAPSGAFRNSIEIVDIDYAIVCASSAAAPPTPPTTNVTAIKTPTTTNITKIVPSENLTAEIIK
jgi:YVTN family beta-propeller protein